MQFLRYGRRPKLILQNRKRPDPAIFLLTMRTPWCFDSCQGVATKRGRKEEVQSVFGAVVTFAVRKPRAATEIRDGQTRNFPERYRENTLQPEFSTSPYNPIWNMAGSRESSRTTSEPPSSYEISASRPRFKGKSQESPYEPGGSDVVRELSREPAMLQIGLHVGERYSWGPSAQFWKAGKRNSYTSTRSPEKLLWGKNHR